MISNTINDLLTMSSGGEGALLAGRYRIVRQLGQGGMGSVWLAEDTQLDNKPFAIKLLPSILVSNKRAYRQLKDEALVAMRLVHPNIVTLRAFEENNGNPFLVMDYIEGQTLDDYLAEKGKLSEDETITLLKPIAVALDYAHGEGVVHRDIKPANVMLRKDGHPYILDFGIAREIQETMTRVTGKLSSGTLLYMSPEQLRGQPPKAAQDVYSFAVMAYECLKGEPPFSRGQIEYQILNEKPAPLPDGVRLSASIMRGLSKKSENRPDTCASVLFIASPITQLPPVPAQICTAPRRMSSQTAERQPAPQKNNAARTIVFVLIGLFVLGGVVWYRNSHQQEPAKNHAITSQSELDSQPSKHQSLSLYTSDVLTDESFGIFVNAVKLIRRVEVYQWKEIQHTRESRRQDGVVTRTTTYTYSKDWSENIIDSDGFKESGHDNPKSCRYKSEEFLATNVTRGKNGVRLSVSQIGQIDNMVPYALPKQYACPLTGAQRVGDAVYLQNPESPNHNPSQPIVGDMRVSFFIVKAENEQVVNKVAVRHGVTEKHRDLLEEESLLAWQRLQSEYNDELQKTQSRLQKLQKLKSPEDKLVLSAEQQQEIAQFRKKQAEMLGRMKEVRQRLEKVNPGKRKVVGIMTSLPEYYIDGSKTNQWTIFKEIQSKYTSRVVSVSAEAIDNDVDVLVLIHPKNLSARTLYAIDQYVLRGGRVVVCVDPFSVMDLIKQRKEPQIANADSYSTLGTLFDAWGVVFTPDKVVADLGASTRLATGDGRYEVNPMFLTFGENNIEHNDGSVKDIKQLMFPFAGSFSFNANRSNISFDKLIFSAQSNSFLVSSEKVHSGISKLQSELIPDGISRVIVARLHGTFPTAFPLGNDTGYMSVCLNGISEIVLFGDADFIAQEFCLMNPPDNRAINDNIVFFMHVLDSLCADGQAK